MLYFSLDAYLGELKIIGKRKELPRKAELAKLLGITPTSFSRIVQNRHPGPTRLQISLIIGEFRRRGFDTTPNDLLRWIDGEDSGN